MVILDSSHFCPVCGFDLYKELGVFPWEGDNPSDEICSSCGIQFGYTDAAGGDQEKRKQIYEEWRKKWVNSGMRWHDNNENKPEEWNPKEQLKNIGINIK
jgi:hypothetical protein